MATQTSLDMLGARIALLRGDATGLLVLGVKRCHSDTTDAEVSKWESEMLGSCAEMFDSDNEILLCTVSRIAACGVGA